MDELKIFDRGLSQAQIQVEINALRPDVSRPPVNPNELPGGKIEKKKY